MTSKTYNGWKNYETWNIALWLQNDEGLYNMTREFMAVYKGRTPYKNFVGENSDILIKTPDKVSFTDRKLSLTELNRCMRELT